MTTGSEASARRLRVAVVASVSPASLRELRLREPRIDLIDLDGLVPTSRFPGDFAGDPAHSRDDAARKRFEESIARADALFGIPDSSPEELARTLRRAPSIRWVHTMAAGGGAQVRAAGLTSAELDRVVFTTSAGVHGGPLAEFAVFGVLAGAKHLPRLLAQQRAREWTERWFMSRLEGRTALVLGLGGIGARIAELLSALGMTVIGANRSGSPVSSVSRVIRLDEVVDAARTADAVICALPGTGETEGLLDERFFAAVHPGATFVNVGRGSVVDEKALIEALENGRLGFAALDVVSVEPLAADSPLWGLDRVVISPHTAALHVDEEARIVQLFAANATRLLDGLEPVNRVDTVNFY